MAETVSPNPDAETEYDVAISFVATDEPLALQIEAALSPLTVFVYSKKQEQLAGRDGVDAFREVFRTRCRLALVLFRPRWGQTPWTRVEETAIRDRCLADGWEHLMFVHLERAPKPMWVPDSKLYLDYQAFGVNDLVGAVKARCADLGVELRPPSVAERARAMAEAQRLDEETQQLLRSSAQPMYDAAAPVFSALATRLDEIRQGTAWSVEVGWNTGQFVAFCNGRSLQLSCAWHQGEPGAELAVRIYTGRVLTPEQAQKGYRTLEEPTRRSEERFALARLPGLGWCWRTRDRRDLTADALAEHAAHAFLSAIQRPDYDPAKLLEEMFARRRR